MSILRLFHYLGNANQETESNRIVIRKHNLALSIQCQLSNKTHKVHTLISLNTYYSCNCFIMLMFHNRYSSEQLTKHVDEEK